MTNYDLIALAINNRSPISFIYNSLYRECCPHAIGLKGVKHHVMMYQFAGQSSKGPIIPGMNEERRCMELDKIQNIELLQGEWHTGNSHSQPNSCIDEVLVSVV